MDIRSGHYILNLTITLFAFLSTLHSLAFWGEAAQQHDPYKYYFQNQGIRIIHFAALFTDTAIVLSMLAWAVTSESERRSSAYRGLALKAFALLGASLAWVELWYGSTFYYGEVRDKQGLPYGVNHFGPVGGFIFLSYVIWTIESKRITRRKAVVLRLIFTLIVLLAEVIVLRVVERPWRLWQS